ncbi:MAG: HlyD family secretion protein [Candidatus Tectomicrobia bacterium]|uniref:HlyD family secretion protein n=1 Tax=Tectimicrobiota bacterium TaxID=2528274 RepID=A0A938B3Q4_UNCTE|nr:HlyD family secretion protein [Candidatus Tectomicrobia bacterium]
MTEKWQKFGKLRVLLPSIVLAIGAVFGLMKGFEYVQYSMKHVTTDDARVKGRMVSVAPEVSGMVKVLRVDEGSVVKAGDVLMELNDTTYRLQLEEAQAQAEMIQRQLQEDKKEYALDVRRSEDQILQARSEVVAKQSALAEERTALVLETEQTRNQIVEAEAALKEAESTVKEMQGQVRIATSNWERAQALFSEGIVPVANRDQAQDMLAQMQARQTATQERVAQLRARLSNAQTAQKRIQLRERKVQTLEAEVEKAQTSVRLVQTELERSKARQEKLQILEARLKEANAKVERVRQSFQDTTVRSPIAGVISRKRIEEGQLVQNGQPVLVISDPKDVWILANIKESYIRDVSVGKPVDISVDAYPDRRFEGKVETIGAAAISEFALFPPTGSFTKVEQRIPVQITVSNTDGLLKPGMMVVVGIVKD